MAENYHPRASSTIVFNVASAHLPRVMQILSTQECDLNAACKTNSHLRGTLNKLHD